MPSVICRSYGFASGSPEESKLFLDLPRMNRSTTHGSLSVGICETLNGLDGRKEDVTCLLNCRSLQTETAQLANRVSLCLCWFSVKWREGRSPLVSIPPSSPASWENPAPSRVRTVEQAAVETATGFRNEIIGWSPIHTGRAGLGARGLRIGLKQRIILQWEEQNWLGQEISNPRRVRQVFQHGRAMSIRTVQQILRAQWLAKLCRSQLPDGASSRSYPDRTRSSF